MLTKTPPNATNSEVVWEVLPPNLVYVGSLDFISINQNGKLETFAVAGPSTAKIRVYSKDNPSIYDECIITVYPDYGSNRYWNFGPTGWYADKRDAQPGAQTPMNWVNGTTLDVSVGMGLTIRGGSGSGGYNQATSTPNGLPAAAGGIPADASDPSLYPPYPWVYTIDPEEPYVVGVNPTNGARSGLNMVAGGNHGADFADDHLTTGGSGRIISIAAIKGPFYIEVRYQSNGSANRWVDIRIGDKEGLRIQGEPSSGTNGVGANVGRKVWHYYEEDDVVPFIFLEGAQGGAFRIYEIIITEEPIE